MPLGRSFGDPVEVERVADEIAGLKPAWPALSREDALALIAELQLARSKLGVVEQRFAEARRRLEEAGLLRR